MNAIALLKQLLERIAGARPRVRRLVLLTAAGVLASAGVAMAVVAIGLQNPGFESPLGSGNWTASTFRDGAYHAANCPDPSNRDAVYDEVCQISGNDTFTVRDGVYDTPHSVTVSPIEGTHMLRLGGPFNDANQLQSPYHGHLVEQTFQVPNTAHPQIDLSYDIYTFDYTGFDNLGVRLQLTDSHGAILHEQNQGSFGPDGDISLKTTGWRPLHFDLSGLGGQTVHLKIWAEGTIDHLYGFWAYLDGPGATAGPVDGGDAQSHPPTDPATGGPADVQAYRDPASGQTFFNVSPGVVDDFPAGGGLSHCMPLDVAVPINPGSGTISNPTLTVDANGIKHPYAMTSGIGGYTAHIDCVRAGTLYVDYDLTEGSTTQHFTVPIGGLTLIDPSGTVVNDSNGHPVAGASVQLFRKNGSNYDNVLSGDPGISPNVNPEATGADGKWGWDVSAGTYRVVVTKSGFNTKTSRDLVVTSGHPITGEVLRLVPVSSGGGGGNGGGTTTSNGGGVANAGGGNNNGNSNGTPAAGGGACSGKHGTALAACVKLQHALAACNKKHGKAKKTCIAQVKARAKCAKVSNKKKRNACIKKANQIGGSKKHGHKH